MTAWRRLRAWQEAGVWEKLHALLLAELHAADQLEWERAIADSSHLQARRGLETGPSPVDRGRRGSKHHRLVDGGGVPLDWTLTGAHRNDVTQLLEPARPGASRALPDRSPATPSADADSRPRLRP
jgi:hypothetical protein